ncbi:hypothetical protein BRADI_1g47525v3 [Brachypodium distachyon]|uniref:Uncharacterized protein n=1 Tax=Brachypodium distachyon TaxID=15368 RepID=A0A2K2DQ10_BRADI|nr:hypothetical protein BRADI_1g47525v3 [Brachypodium distachyon]
MFIGVFLFSNFIGGFVNLYRTAIFEQPFLLVPSQIFWQVYDTDAFVRSRCSSLPSHNICIVSSCVSFGVCKTILHMHL